jgi:lipopolysaccharide transport protein LptA
MKAVDEDGQLNNAAQGKRPRVCPPTNSTVMVFAISMGWLLLSSGPLRGLVQAQTPSERTTPATASNSAQNATMGLKQTTKTTTNKRDAKANDNQSNKTDSQDSKTQDNESPFGSLTGSNRGPISIQSDTLALAYKKNTVLFSGHVHATQADGVLTCDTLNVKYGKDFHEVQDMAADGNVHISQGVRWCTSDHAVMNQGQHTVILTGSPICHDAQDQITGTRITVHLDTGKSDVEAARAVIFPQQSKTRDNEALAAKTK